MAAAFDSNFSFNQQLWYYYTTNRGKIRSRYNDLTRKFLAYNDSEENPHAFLRKPQFEALEMYVFVKEFMNQVRFCIQLMIPTSISLSPTRRRSS